MIFFKKLPIIFLGLIDFGILYPAGALAQTDGVLDSSAPLGGLPQGTAPSELIDSLYRLGLGLGAFLAFAWIVYAGFRYAWGGDSAGVRSDAKDRITQALLGLLLLIGATALLNIVNAQLSTLNDPVINTVVVKAVPPPIPPEILSGGPVTAAEPGPGEQEAFDKDETVRNDLRAAGVEVNKAKCPVGVSALQQPGGCTTVGGLRETTIAGAKWIQANCNCGVMITGGSERGHAAGPFSHMNGYKIDIRKTGILEFIRSRQSDRTFLATSPRSGTNGGPRFYQLNSSGQRVAEWVDEGDHWDITFYQVP